MTVFKTDAWTSENITRKQYYYHKYDSDQPDLNLRNVRVREEMNQTFRFWLDNGASGFRLLSVPYLFEDRDAIASDNEEEKLTKNLDETYNYIAEIRGIMQEYEDGDGNHRHEENILSKSSIISLAIFFNLPECCLLKWKDLIRKASSSITAMRKKDSQICPLTHDSSSMVFREILTAIFYGKRSKAILKVYLLGAGLLGLWELEMLSAYPLATAANWWTL